MTEPHGVDTSLDPHGELGHHGHVIVPVRVLLGVLVALLALTALTVGASRAEVWAGRAFDVEIPQWVNVGVALTIAVVKSVLVAMYFMQLRYDNPLHTLVFLFCLFAFALFLFFAMVDLGTRAKVYPIKAGEVVRGGTGNVRWGQRVWDAERGEWKTVTVTGPIATFAHEQFAQRVGPERLAEIRADVKGHAEHPPEPAPPSTASRSRPLRGLTGALEMEGNHGGH